MRRLWLVVFLVFAASCGSVPPATRSQRAQVQVVLYTTRWCPVCAQARGWLDSRGINYWERDVEREADAAYDHRRINPSRTVPTMNVEGRVVIGFVPEEWRAAIDLAAARY